MTWQAPTQQEIDAWMNERKDGHKRVSEQVEQNLARVAAKPPPKPKGKWRNTKVKEKDTLPAYSCPAADEIHEHDPLGARLVKEALEGGAK